MRTINSKIPHFPNQSEFRKKSNRKMRARDLVEGDRSGEVECVSTRLTGEGSTLFNQEQIINHPNPRVLDSKATKPSAKPAYS